MPFEKNGFLLSDCAVRGVYNETVKVGITLNNTGEAAIQSVVITVLDEEYPIPVGLKPGEGVKIPLQFDKRASELLIRPDSLNIQEQGRILRLHLSKCRII